jgi:hypothetical protein
MTAFEAGFIKEAVEYGLSESQATHMLYRAVDYKEASELLKSSAKLDRGEQPDTLDTLAAMLEQQGAFDKVKDNRKRIRL